MFWADRIAEEIRQTRGGKGSLLIRDEKTISGRIHVGAMRGVLIHGTISAILTERGISNNFVYELNDFDAFDTVPVYLDAEKFTPHLGEPLFVVPSPDSSAKSYSDYFGREFSDVITKMGYTPEFRSSVDAYRSGKYNDVIRIALENAGSIRAIYKKVSGGKRSEEWLPIMMICEQCGKIATTRAVSFDGKIIQYVCDQEASGAKGCGFEGTGSPYDGNAKLPWKVEWAAKFTVFDVAVEGEGKDFSTKGGAGEVANHISQEVFKREPPFDIRYEHFLIGGRKMSTSKGRGSSAKEIADLMPPKIFRLALLGRDINQAFNFGPEGDTIPVLYDQYDKLALGYATTKDDDYARLFELIHPLKEVGLPSQKPLPRFSQVAFAVQMPHLDLEKEFPEADKAELHERALYAKRWLDAYAPEKFVFKLQESLPAVEITKEQKTNLKQVKGFLEQHPSAAAEDIHSKLHELKEFKGIYLAFLGKDHGPKAGWFIASLPRDFVLARLKEAAA